MRGLVRVGLVGADATGRGWGAVAHVPALRAVGNVELAAVCTSSIESARASAEVFQVGGAFADVGEMARQPDIDAVAVAVRVPRHQALVVPALEAGKHVFCEWPLGANSAEALTMSSIAARQGVSTSIGLQGRHEPAIQRIRQLVESRWLGRVVSVRATLFGSGLLRHRPETAWMAERSNGANALTIMAGHILDYMQFAVAPIGRLSASLSTQAPTWSFDDSDVVVDADAPDSITIHGFLESGSQFSLEAGSVPFHAPGWSMDIFGTEATIRATSPAMPQISPLQLLGARGDEPLTELTVAQSPGQIAELLPPSPALNVARGYQAWAASILDGVPFAPDFKDALRLHEILDDVQESAARGVAVVPREANP